MSDVSIKLIVHEKKTSHCETIEKDKAFLILTNIWVSSVDQLDLVRAIRDRNNNKNLSLMSRQDS